MLIRCPLKTASSRLPVWIDSVKTYSFDELDTLADLWTTQLIQAKIGPLDRIAVRSYPNIHLAALFFAAWRLGAAVCPLNMRIPPLGIEGALKKLKARLYYDFSKDGYKLTETKKTSLDTVDPHLPALFLMTSGSTAEPKIAVLSLQNLLKNAEGTLELLEVDERSRWLLNLPLFHVGGIGILIRSILARGAVVLDPKYPDITHISSVPTQLYRASPVYKNLRCVLLGGAPIVSYPSYLPIVGTYGLTEMGSMVLAQKRPIDGFLGFGLPNRKVRLAEDGEIWVGGESLFQGYWEEKKIQKSSDWFATKDLGKLDPKLGIQILGRKDWQFISGGENIQPEEIEKYLLKIPGIEEAVVLPKEDPEFGKRPIAVIAGQTTLKKLQEELSAYLPKYKIPIDLISLPSLPKKGIKIDRKALYSFFSS